MNPDDEYDAAIDRAAADAVRALLVVPHASPEGARALRQTTSWLADTRLRRGTRPHRGAGCGHGRTSPYFDEAILAPRLPGSTERFSAR